MHFSVPEALRNVLDKVWFKVYHNILPIEILKYILRGFPARISGFGIDSEVPQGG